MKQYLQVILAITVILGLSCNHKQEDKYVVNKGVMDISQHTIDDLESIPINGKWEFYWNKLLRPSDFHNQNQIPLYATVPGAWCNVVTDGLQTSPEGFATYRVIINTNINDSIFGLKINRINTAYNLWVNGALISSIGKLSESKENHTRAWAHLDELITSDNNKIEIVIQVSNFGYNKGGIVKAIQLTSKKYLQNTSKTDIGIDFLLIGVFMIIALYHFLLFFLRRDVVSALYFSILLLFISALIIVSKDYNLLTYLIYPKISWIAHLKIEFIIYLLSQLVLVLYITSQYKTELKHLFTKMIYAFLGIMVLLLIILPIETFLKIYSFFDWSFMGIVIYLVYVTYKAIINERADAKQSFVALLILGFTVVYDFIANRYSINSFDLLPFGFLGFTLVHIYVISAQFVGAINYSEQLTEDVDFLNNNLEKIVKDRTLKVEQQKEELMIQSENLKMANDEIVNINEVLQKQGNEMSKKNRSLTDSLNYAKRLQTAVLPDPKYLKQVLPEHFIFYQPKDIVSGDFYWYGEVDSSWDFDDASSTQVLVAADCTGHGVPGAFMTLLGHNFLHLTVNIQQVVDPEQIIYKVDQQVVETLKQNEPHSIKDGMDISVLTIEQEKNIISFSGAGNPLYYFSEGEFYEIKGANFGIGGVLRKEKVFVPHKIEYKSGDVFYIFSDGYSDQTGGIEGRKFYKKRFKEFLKKIHTYPIPEQEKMIRDNFFKWKGDNKQIDDILVIGLKMP